jgi:superfamily II DNA or RNA helicase
MYLITSVVLSEKDKNAIEAALAESEAKVLNEITDIEDELKRDHISMLGWMVKNGKLNIKVAVVSSGIAHQKIGILEDKYGNVLSFNGSDNETAFGWLFNDETFHVFRSWKEENEHLKDDLSQFEKMWSGQTNKTQIYSVSDAFKKGLIKVAPKNEEEFKELSSRISKNMGQLKSNVRIKKDMRDYQKQAVKAWVENDFKGILEMATGTGKTFTSLNGIEELAKKTKKLLCVITVPYLYLVSQWKKEFITFFDEGFYVKEAHSEIREWERALNEFIQEYNMGVINKLSIFTVYDTFATEKFQNIIHKYLDTGNEILLVSDECHFLGSDEFSKGMKEIYKYRLGLSATPQRWFDEEGSQKLIEYFGGTVFSFSLKEAIPKYLTPYDYFPRVVKMSDDELDRYYELANRISKVFHYRNAADESESNSYITKLLIERAKIIVNNEEKKIRYREILLDLKNRGLIDHLLVYCSPEQLDWAQEVLNEYNISNHKFTFYENPEQRTSILEHFEKGAVKAIVAMRCLDQGLDLPSIKTAIILASSTNPIQYIQRRGRVLRKYPGKEQALIYDFIVESGEKQQMDEELFNIEQKIIVEN